MADMPNTQLLAKRPWPQFQTICPPQKPPHCSAPALPCTTRCATPGHAPEKPLRYRASADLAILAFSTRARWDFARSPLAAALIKLHSPRNSAHTNILTARPALLQNFRNAEAQVSFWRRLPIPNRFPL